MTMSQLEIVVNFCKKHDIDDDGKDEMLDIIKNSIVQVAMGFLSMPGIGVAPAVKGAKGAKAKTTTKKMCAATTKAGNNCKKSAQEGKEFCKLHAPKVTTTEESGSDDEAVLNERGGNTCGGVMQSGEPCNNKKGKLTQPDGATGWYCFRHKKNWTKFEGENVSEEEKEVELTEEQIEEMKANGIEDKDEYLKSIELFEKTRNKVTKGMTEEDKVKFDEETTFISDNDISDDPKSDNDEEGAFEKPKEEVKKHRRPRIKKAVV